MEYPYKHSLFAVFHIALLAILVSCSISTKLKSFKEKLQAQKSDFISSSILIKSSPRNLEAAIRFSLIGHSESNYFVGLIGKACSLIGKYNNNYLQSNSMQSSSGISLIDSESEIKATNLNISSKIDLNSSFIYMKVSQWQLIYSLNLTLNNSKQLANGTLSSCNGLSYFLSNCNRGITFSLDHLITHASLSVKASISFIGSWNNDSSYITINDGLEDQDQGLEQEQEQGDNNNTNIIWAASCKNSQINNQNNSCGKTICKLNQQVSFSIKHNSDSIFLSFLQS